ncbi:MAG TPA: ATP synthase F1 subunit delta [Prolixibacteraceae bacterium]|jgi:F-type H+-transporting ATPase subunit delta|nr:ATP synthase F1 subunit delta [Prolixibacteraceae bacterium]
MDQSKINVRYAKAFFSLAKEKGLTEELHRDALLISSVCNSISDFMVLIESPVISNSGKVKAFKSIFEGKVNPYSLRFLVLIAENNREKFIPGIFRNLEDLYRKSQGIKTAILTTAKPMDQALVEQIRKSLETELGGKVELSQVIDKELIGGFVLRVDDSQYDASISAQLKKIKDKLLQTELK